MSSLNNYEYTDYPHCFLICGKPKSGKTHFTKALLYHLFENCGVEFGLLLTGSAFNKEDYGFFPRTMEVTDSDDVWRKISKYITPLRNEVKQGREVQPNVLILDDLLGLIDTHSKEFINFITCYRKTNTHCILTSQYMNKNVSTTFRECVSDAVMFRSNTKNTLKSYYDNFGGLFASYNEFTHYLSQLPPYTACYYVQEEQDINKNYHFVRVGGKLSDKPISTQMMPAEGRSKKEQKKKAVEVEIDFNPNSESREKLLMSTFQF
jgi:hypothetical protein